MDGQSAAQPGKKNLQADPGQPEAAAQAVAAPAIMRNEEIKISLSQAAATPLLCATSRMNYGPHADAAVSAAAERAAALRCLGDALHRRARQLRSGELVIPSETSGTVSRGSRAR